MRGPKVTRTGNGPAGGGPPFTGAPMSAVPAGGFPCAAVPTSSAGLLKTLGARHEEGAFPGES